MTALSRLLFWTMRPFGLLAPMMIRSSPRARGLEAETTTLAKQWCEPAREGLTDAQRAVEGDRAVVLAVRQLAGGRSAAGGRPPARAEVEPRAAISSGTVTRGS